MPRIFCPYVCQTRTRPLCLQSFVENHRPVDFPFRRMPLGDAADQLEGSEGIKPLAVIFADFPASLAGGDLPHALQEVSLRRAVEPDRGTVLLSGFLTPSKLLCQIIRSVYRLSGTSCQLCDFILSNSSPVIVRIVPCLKPYGK